MGLKRKCRNLQVAPLVEANENLLECLYCDYSSKHKYAVLKHQLTHAPPGEKQFRCELCSYGTHFKVSLENHVRGHTGEKPYMCPVCEKQFRQKQHMKLHVDHVHEEKKRFHRLKCTRCEFTSNCKTAMAKHKQAHPAAESSPQVIGRDDGDGIEHVRGSCKSSLPPYTCGLCSLNFKCHSYLQRHVMTHTGEMPFQCPVCGKGFIQQFSFTRHALIHSDKPPPVKCDRCDARFTRKSQLESHNIRMHGKERFKCTKCDKSFMQKKHLREHEQGHRVGQKHDKQEPFKCDTCSLEFLERYQLTTHKRVEHNEEERVKCSQCDKTVSKKSLPEHEQRHKKGLPFTCTRCSKKFKTQHDLRQHLRKTLCSKRRSVKG